MKFLKLSILMLGFTQVLSTNVIAHFKDDLMFKKDLKLFPETHVSKNENDLRNIPFALGIEVAFGGTFESQGEVFPGFLFFMDLNISNKVFFLKAEYGKLYSLQDEDLYNYASVGFNYKVTDDKKHNFYIHGAALAIWGKGGGGPGLSLAFRYRYTIADQVGLVTSLRYPMGSFKSIMVTAGLQFFAF